MLAEAVAEVRTGAGIAQRSGRRGPAWPKRLDGEGERWLREPSSPRRIGRGLRTYGRLLRCRARSTQMLPSRTPADGGGVADLANVLPPPPVRRLENRRGRKTHPALINHEVEGTNYLLHRHCRGVTVSGIPGDENRKDVMGAYRSGRGGARIARPRSPSGAVRGISSCLLRCCRTSID